MAAKFRVGRYNWYGQKLLVQHQYSNIISLHENLNSTNSANETNHAISDHFNYLRGLALIRTGSHLDEVICSLQQLDYEQNSQYFLLLCQCLVYLGNCDSVVALCRRVIHQENKSLTKDPRMWYIFGLCLEFLHQFKDAHAALQMATELIRGGQRMSGEEPSDVSCTRLSDYHAPHIKEVEFCIKYQGDMRSANKLLNEARQLFPQNRTICSTQALVLSTQTHNQKTNITKAVEMLSLLEHQLICNRNPSSRYNKLAHECRFRANIKGLCGESSYISMDNDKDDIDFLLAKSHIHLNSMAQKSGFAAVETSSVSVRDDTKVDKLIETLRNTEADCWVTSSLWNNLGLCYLSRRRFIACLSCLIKANISNPLDWRINYNLAIANILVKSFNRALTHLHAAKNIRSLSLTQRYREESGFSVMVDTLLAICYEYLGEYDESRRLYIQSIRCGGSNPSSIPICTLVNYLVFLHKNSSDADEQDVKIRSHLLDQLEQCWLQRNQNDPQFHLQLLDAARHVGGTKKVYAWTKSSEID